MPRKKKPVSCKVRGCTKAAYSSGFCMEHWYNEDQSNGTLLLTVEKKVMLLNVIEQMLRWFMDADAYGSDLVTVFSKAANKEPLSKAEWIIVFEARDFFAGLGSESKAYWERAAEELEIELK